MKRLSRIQKAYKRKIEWMRRLMAEGNHVRVSYHSQEFQVFRCESEYLVILAGVHVKNPHPSVLRKAREALNRAIVSEVLDR